jgi:hypothetical protein
MRSDERTESPLGPDVMATLDASRGPKAEVEERVVYALQRDRWLSRAGAGARGLRSPWMVGLLAASVTFFVGVQVGGRRAESRAAVSTAATDANAEERLRRAAVEYIQALAAVRPDMASARGAALSTFRTAADQIVRLAPMSDVSIAMQIAFPSSFAQTPRPVVRTVPVTNIIRF